MLGECREGLAYGGVGVGFRIWLGAEGWSGVELFRYVSSCSGG